MNIVPISFYKCYLRLHSVVHMPAPYFWSLGGLGASAAHSPGQQRSIRRAIWRRPALQRGIRRVRRAGERTSRPRHRRRHLRGRRPDLAWRGGGCARAHRGYRRAGTARQMRQERANAPMSRALSSGPHRRRRGQADSKCATTNMAGACARRCAIGGELARP